MIQSDQESRREKSDYWARFPPFISRFLVVLRARKEGRKLVPDCLCLRNSWHIGRIFLGNCRRHFRPRGTGTTEFQAFFEMTKYFLNEMNEGATGMKDRSDLWTRISSIYHRGARSIGEEARSCHESWGKEFFSCWEAEIGGEGKEIN